MTHTVGGWDNIRNDPMFAHQDMDHRHLIAWTLENLPLSQQPGTRYAYSNFGYCLLGRVIEKVTGQSYETFVRQAVLGPAGIKRMRLGRILEYADGEVRYYHEKDERATSGFNLEAMDSHGGWIASAVDLGRFAAALDDPQRSPLLKRGSFATMYAPPLSPVWRKADGSLDAAYYGCGWLVRPVGKSGKANYWHTGSLPGTATLLVRRWDGFSWAVLFNQRSDDKELPDSAIDPAL